MKQFGIVGSNETYGFPDDMSEEDIKRELARQARSLQDPNLITTDYRRALPEKPELRQVFSSNIADFLTKSGLLKNNYQAQRVGENLTTFLEFMPGTGAMTAGDDFGRYAKKEDWLGAGLSALELSPVAEGAGMAVAPLVAKASNIKRLFHGSPEKFDKFDPFRTGDRITSLGTGHYLTPDKKMAKQYGENVMEFDVDVSGFLDWDNLSNSDRKIIEAELIKSIPENRISHFGSQKFEVLKRGKDGAKRFKEIQDKTKDAYNDYAKARVLGDDEIPDELLETLGVDDVVVGWRESDGLGGANNQQLMTLMNEYRPELAKELGYKGSMFGNQVAVYDSEIPQIVKSLPMDNASRKYPLADRGEWWGDADYEKRGGVLVEMSPRDYLSQVRKVDEKNELTIENVDDLASHVNDGGTLDPLVIYEDGMEDGRHRALMAEKLGIKKVPVIDFR